MRAFITFRNRIRSSGEEAGAALATAIHSNQAIFDDWVGKGAIGKLEMIAPFSGGSVLVDGVDSVVPGSIVTMVLKSDGSGGWYVLTGMVDP